MKDTMQIGLEYYLGREVQETTLLVKPEATFKDLAALLQTDFPIHEYNFNRMTIERSWGANCDAWQLIPGRVYSASPVDYVKRALNAANNGAIDTTAEDFSWEH